jgi:transglutaminase/protease-like cytokinesis protein 3
MGCHVFSVQHKNKTAQSRFSSEKSSINSNACASFAVFRELQESANARRPTPLNNRAVFGGTQEDSASKFTL